MALGAQHVEPTHRDDVLGLRVGLALDRRQLVMPSSFVLIRSLHRVQAAIAQAQIGEEVHVAAQHHVGAAAGHVGGHGDGAATPRLGHDGGFLLVELGVEHVVRHTALGQLSRQVLRALDAGGADQHRLTGLVALGDVVDDRDVLGFLGLVDQVGLVGANHRPVRRDRHHTELVDLLQFGGLGLGGARHAGQLVVEAEVVLQGDGGEGLVLGLDLHLLLGLDGLVHAFVIAPARQHPAGELVDDDDLAVAHDVVLVAAEQFFGLQTVVQIAHQRRVGRCVEILDPDLVFDEFHALFVHAHRALADVDLVVDVLLHHRSQPGEFAVPVRGAVGRSGNDQRRAGLVDQDRVDFVDDRVGVAALHQVLQRVRHVVAQVVEPELVVGAVGDVGAVGHAALVRGEPGEDHPDI